MLEKVKDYVERYQMLTSEDRVIVGVSGGADSVCLLLVLLELKKNIGFDIVAVHVNHGLRGVDADADEAFVKRFCEERDVPLEVYFADVQSIAKEKKQSTEEAGREVRKEFFEQVRVKHGGTKIALAHHQNDNAETFVFRLARGTGLKGLGGMAPIKGQMIRPLLCVRRTEIEAYLQKQEVLYCTDKTNESDIYVRNLIRNQVIPRLEEGVNSKTVEHISDTMEQIRLVQEYLEEQTEAYLRQSVKQTEKGYLVLEEMYQQVPEVLKRLLLKEVLARVCRKEKDLEGVHLRQIQELFAKQTGRKIDLPYHTEAKRVYEGIEIYRKGKAFDEPAEEIFWNAQESEASFRWKDKTIHCRVMNKNEIDGETLEKSNTKRFDCDIIKHNICFRTRREGDYITIHPDGRTQKLKTYFINEKIPQEERDKILLVADGNHIMWIVGYRVNCVYQTKENTGCVLKIRIDKGEKNGRDS